MSISNLERRFFGEPDLPNSISAHIRSLKSEGRNEEAQQQRKVALREAKTKRVRDVLNTLSRDGHDVGSLTIEKLDALVEWQKVRVAYQRQEISTEDFRAISEKFAERYESNMDDETVVSGLRIISQRYSRT